MKFLDKLEEVLLMIGLSLMGLSVAAQIFMRYLFNMPLIWSEEFARYIFVWITFIGAGYGVRKGSHIAMEYFFNKFSLGVRRTVSLAMTALSVAAFAYLIPTAVFFMLEQDKIASSAMQMPMSWLFAAVPIGCAMMVFRLGVNFVRLMKGGDVK